MAFRFEEKPGSGNSTIIPAYREKVYYASGSKDENFVLNAAVAATPAAIFTPQGKLYRQDVRLSWKAAAYCEVSVPYTKRNVNEPDISFDTTGGTVHITSSRQTVEKYGVGGAGDAPDMKQTIGVNGDDVDGCDIAVPALKLTVSFRHPSGVITMAQVRSLARSTAYVNSDVWLGFQPGEVLFLGASGGWGPETETTIQYQFACSENAENGVAGDKRLTIGDIANIVKKGHDYVWVRYVDDVDAGRPIKKAKHVYVERVYETVSFFLLFGFN